MRAVEVVKLVVLVRALEGFLGAAIMVSESVGMRLSGSAEWSLGRELV